MSRVVVVVVAGDAAVGDRRDGAGRLQDIPERRHRRVGRRLRTDGGAVRHVRRRRRQRTDEEGRQRGRGRRPTAEDLHGELEVSEGGRGRAGGRERGIHEIRKNTNFYRFILFIYLFIYYTVFIQGSAQSDKILFYSVALLLAN